MFEPGTVFRNPGNMGHMWTIVAVAQDDTRLMGNWSSKKSNIPVTCLLVPSDHPAITHDSYFVYGEMREYTPDQIHDLIASGNFKPAGAINEATLKRIQDGIFTDKKVPPIIRTRYAHLKR